MSEDQNATAPRVSVIIPAHNCKEYLPGAFKTIEEQQVDNVEVVVVDDGSKDGTWEYLAEVESELPFKLQKVKLGGEGPGAARNAAIKAANSPILAFLDADDRWTVNKLEPQLKFHENNPSVVLSFTDYVHITEEDERLGDCFQYWPRFYEETKTAKGYRKLGERAAAMIFAENIVGTSTVMASKDKIQELEGFDASLRSAQDWDLWVRLALSGDVACTDAVDGIYLMRKGSVTGNAGLRLKCMRQIIERHKKAISDIDFDSVSIAEARVDTGEAEFARQQKQFGKAFQFHFNAWTKAPSLRAFRSVARDAVSLILRR